MPSRYPHRSPVEIKLLDLQQGHIPIYDQEIGLWFTVPSSSFKEGAISSSQQITIGDTAGDTFGDKDYTFQRNLTVNQNLSVLGRLTAKEYYTQIVSASIIYEQGSTKFGDSPDDTHEITGSLLVSGDARVDGNFEITGNIFFGQAGGTVAVFSGDLNVVGASLFEGSMTVNNRVEIYSSLFVRDEIFLGNNINLNHQIIGQLQLNGNLNVLDGVVTASRFIGTASLAETSSLSTFANTAQLATSSSFANTVGIIAAGIYVTGSDIPITKQ